MRSHLILVAIDLLSQLSKRETPYNSHLLKQHIRQNASSRPGIPVNKLRFRELIKRDHFSVSADNTLLPQIAIDEYDAVQSLLSHKGKVVLTGRTKQVCACNIGNSLPKSGKSSL